jgi:hypothetical protein
MTTKKATADATADPYEMTTRKATGLVWVGWFGF